MMEKEEIRRILPHREPLLLVDRVTALEEGKRITAEVTVQKDWPVFEGHFPEHPVLPGIYLVESMAQTADILLLEMDGNQGKLPLFFQISMMRFYHPVYPGDQLQMTAELTADAGSGMYDCRVTARTQKGRAAAGIITLAMRDKK